MWLVSTSHMEAMTIIQRHLITFVQLCKILVFLLLSMLDTKGYESMISMSYKNLPLDEKPGNTILCADGSISRAVLSCDPESGTVRCRCDVNLPGVVVDLPNLTDKDIEDIIGWGVPNSIDMIALSFLRKASDLC